MTTLGGWAHAHRAVGLGARVGTNSAETSVPMCQSLFFIIQEAPRKAAQLTTVRLHSILRVDSTDPTGSIPGFQPEEPQGSPTDLTKWRDFGNVSKG